MEKSTMAHSRKKKIKRLLSMMNKQNQRLIPIAQPLVEMMDMVTTDEELAYLLRMGTELYDYDKAVKASNMSNAKFQSFFETIKRKGAVHSVIHERDDYRLPVMAICNCCWDCCGILKPYNMGAVALKYKAFYTARIMDDADCKGCRNCEKYCPTTAIRLVDKQATLNSDKCIGCGQCAFQCRQNNIELYPNERVVFLPILKTSEARVSV